MSNPAKIEVVHNGVAFNNNDFRGLAEKQKQNPIVLFLGRITLQKGPDYFITTAKRVLEHNPEVTFVMAGKGK